jgi:RES domain-containing protein
MPTVWRLSAAGYADLLTGEGNRIFGARWNSPGQGVVYTSANLSLAVLESYVHIPVEQRDTLPDFEAVRISVPDDAGVTAVSHVELTDLLLTPDPISACRSVGDRWLMTADDLMLSAASVIVPEEFNIMLNPAHPRMNEVRIVAKRLFRFDDRLAMRRQP